MKIKTYSELLTLQTFKERFEYLRESKRVGEETFGMDRYINQTFYHSAEWKRVRDQVIIRDNACDLAIPDREIHSKILIHHMNPITLDDLYKRTEFLLNPEYLITTCKRTHDAIHFSDDSILMMDPVIRRPGDTCPWA